MEPTVGEHRSPDSVTADSPAVQLPDGPLGGLRVVEFGQLLAGPYVGTLLGDFGAEVVKVEPPPGG
ncbi:MAG TPA: CoA transferase, partial [Solirubrobacteraceae bacterium]